MRLLLLLERRQLLVDRLHLLHVLLDYLFCCFLCHRRWRDIGGFFFKVEDGRETGGEGGEVVGAAGALDFVLGDGAGTGGVTVGVEEEEVGGGEGGGVGGGGAAGGVAGGGGGSVRGGGGGGGGEEEGADHGDPGREVEGEELALVEELVGGALLGGGAPGGWGEGDGELEV